LPLFLKNDAVGLVLRGIAPRPIGKGIAPLASCGRGEQTFSNQPRLRLKPRTHGVFVNCVAPYIPYEVMMSTQPSKILDTFPNPKPERDYTIRFECPEFTCVCPKTGQPDFATISIHYVPDQFCVELKSLKLYLWSYRNEGAFHEAITNRILDDLVAAVSPRKITVIGDFYVRGGIKTIVEVTHTKPHA
jgi:7-cyano-7-deazaguanine reductase